MVPDPRLALLSPRIEAEELRERGLGPWLGPGSFALEIGFGRGELLIALAREHPERTHIGVEVSRKRVEKVERRVQRAGLSNVKLVHAPAEYLLERVLPAASIAECWINCPDPWPKKRHHRRRFFQPGVVAQLARTLAPGALLHVSTDHAEYAEWIHHAMSSCAELDNLWAPERWSSAPPARPRTAYEEEWIAEGRSLHYFDYASRARLPA
jgi:tRNA (guanine-N7-)-methyltransferase